MEDLRELKTINFENNRIEYIFTRAFNVAFDRSCSLINVNLAKNNIPSENYEFSAFRNCENLRILNLSNNNISKIHENWKSLKNLEILNLSNNSFSSLNFSVIIISLKP